MITRKPTTAKGYYYYHKLMWGRIVKKMEKGVILDGRVRGKIWYELFGFVNTGIYCFPCAWKRKNEHMDEGPDEECNECCLLEFDGNACLGGLYDVATGISDQRIVAVRKIRDLPMKDKWK